MYIGNVASLPVRKKARTNSSKEIIKLSNSDAIMPGKYNGNDTLKKVPQAFSPRSLEASSNEKSNPSIRAIKISIANGVQKSIWPKVTGTSPSLKPRANQIISKDTARIISGIKNGIIIAP